MHDFLKAWHARHAGATATTFGHWTGADGRSSYARLADIAAAEGAGRVLDLCCGDGLLIELTEARLPAAQVVGVDGSPAELVAAWSRLGPRARLLQADAAALPLPEASVDVALCHMALMLLDDIDAAVAELARVLRPGGVFAAVVGAAGRDAGYQVFLDPLFERLEAEAVPPLGVVERRALSEEGLAGLFAAPRWAELRTEVFEVGHAGSAEQAWADLSTMYNVDTLSPEGQAAVQARALAGWRAMGEPVRIGSSLRLVVARRAG
ncbi:MAG: class I SAM-dependent methyltransferase [Alphaproteobacteria bacterium]|nr:class I SAM-dependent methyltransferase [Alphaproteobacteria bacterium]